MSITFNRWSFCLHRAQAQVSRAAAKNLKSFYKKQEILRSLWSLRMIVETQYLLNSPLPGWAIINVVSKKHARTIFNNGLVLIGLLALILCPRWLSGWFDLHRAERANDKGHFSESALYYALAASRLPFAAYLWEQAGVAALNAQRPDDARAYFLTALEKNALSTDGWLALGEAYWQSDQRNAAMNIWENADATIAADRMLAFGHRGLGDLTLAIKDLQSILDEDPYDTQALYQLGLILAATQPEEALSYLIRAASLDTELDQNVHSLQTSLNTALLEDEPAYRFTVAGRALASLNEWDLALTAFEHAVQLRPDYSEAWAWLGEARQQQGLNGKSELERALDLDPQSIAVKAMWGLYWQRQGQLDEAIQAFKQVTTLEPENPAWQAALGGIYEQSGDLVEAFTYYLQAVELAPKEVIYWQALAEFCLRNNVDIAETGFHAAQQLLNLIPNDWQSHDIYGQVFLETDDLLKAEIHFLKAIELAPQQPAPHLRLGLVYLQKGERAEARDHLINTCDLDLSSNLCWQAQRLLEQYFP